MDPDTALVPSSPTNSSPSSSDLDTESTGSFFPDRSTTLGTLMGVNFAIAEARVPSRRERGVCGAAAKKAADRLRRRTREGRRRSWWRLCRDDMAGPTSLGDFLQVERMSLEGGVGGAVADGRLFTELFKNGRVLPPQSSSSSTAATVVVERRRREKVPVLLAGICSGGDG